MIQALEHLIEVFEYQVFEVCGHGPKYYVPYMKNDAVEDCLVLRLAGFFHGRNRKGWIEKYDYKD